MDIHGRGGRHVGATVLVVALLAGCGSATTETTADADAATQGSDESAAGNTGAGLPPDRVAARVDEAMSRLSESAGVEEAFSEDYGEGVASLTTRAGVAGLLLSRLPGPPLAGTTAEQESAYASMPDELEVWQTTAQEAVAELVDARDDLEPLLAAWADGADEEPPAAYTEALEREEEAATAFGDACAAFMDATGLTADCYAPLDAGTDATITTYELTVGEVSTAYDIAGVDFDTQLDEGWNSWTDKIRIQVSAPPPVADPAELHTDERTPIPDPLPWPDDLAGWYEQLPVEVLDRGELALAGESLTWSYVVLVGTEPERFALLNIEEEQSWMTGPGGPEPGEALFEVVLWETTIDGQTIVAISDGDPDMAYEDHFEQARQVLDTFRVVQ